MAMVTIVPAVQEEEDMVLAKFSLKEQAPLASCCWFLFERELGFLFEGEGEREDRERESFGVV